ncbi:hypothetical protein Tco_1354462 [Tanacetum coccineum]
MFSSMSDSEESIVNDPPSPDYVPGPEEPEQALPSPIYVPFIPEPVYPKFLPVDDEVNPAGTAQCLLLNLPTHIKFTGRKDDEEHPYDDDDDDDDAEEEEHLAPADPAAVAHSADQDPYLPYRVTARIPCLPRRRQAVPSRGLDKRCTTISKHETEMPEDLYTALRTRPSRTTPGTLIRGSGRVRQLELMLCIRMKIIIYSQLDDARHDRALLRARVNMLYRDRPFHRRTALLMEEEARVSRAAWAQSMDACDQVRSEGISLRTTVMAQQSEITELQAADRRRQTVISDLLKADHRRQRQLVEALKIVKSLKTQMIELQRQQGPAKDPAEPELPEEASSSS